MSWITVIWSMVAAACLTLAAMHLLVWFKKRTAWANLLFSVTAAAAAAVAFCELSMMRAETPEQFGTMLRWFHVPVWAIIVALVVFVRLHLRAGRSWLAWTICTLRTFSLLLNFVVGQDLNYREVTGLRHIPFFGESVVVAEGASNPFMLVGQLSLLLFVIFVADAAITVWRRGDRRQALMTGGSIVFFVLAGTVQAVLVLWQIVPGPITVSLFFTAVVAAMAYEMSGDPRRAAQLSADLRESEARLALAADSADVGLWSWDFKTGQIWATERARLLYGFSSAEEIAFEKFLSRIHPDDRDRVSRAAREAFQNGAGFRSEYRIELPDGSSRWIKAQGQAFLKPSREPDRMMGVSLNINERKENEDEVVELRLELAHLARIMTMNEVSTSLAHEINQPLGAILNNASAAKLLMSQVKDRQEEINEILEDVIQDAKRAGDVVRKIRGVVKKSDVRFEPLDMNSLIGEAADLFRNSMSMSNVSLRLDLEMNLAKVTGDRVHLQQVLVNLITNALEAMKGRSPSVLTIHSAMTASDRVTVSVSDTGKGIDDAAKERVFEPFFTTKQDGLGMGLRICRSIIAEHGGRIWAENNPIAGATFSFSLGAWRGESA